ncbi:hypothetical protein SAMN05414139_05956 [Burkholderia sp. D7]|nr:hypothetical protein SAMN05414139_05956 [Burkholderia sp. D7]
MRSDEPNIKAVSKRFNWMMFGRKWCLHLSLRMAAFRGGFSVGNTADS